MQKLNFASTNFRFIKTILLDAACFYRNTQLFFVRKVTLVYLEFVLGTVSTFQLIDKGDVSSFLLVQESAFTTIGCL